MAGNREIEQLLNACQIAFTNAKNEPDLQAVLAPFGYTPERLDAGLALLATARDLYAQQQTEYAESYTATATLKEKAAAARAAYMRHVTLARVAFKRGTAGYNKLGLAGDRRDELPGWMAQARHFYRNLLAEAALLTKMSTLTLDQPAAEAAQAALDEVEAAQAAQVKESGEAQTATQQRDEAVAELRGYKSDFDRIAEVATAGQPQLREKLGLLERS